MAVVKVLMMEKDEVENLARWLAHYAYLFGFENLTIFDNGSTNPATISLLKSAESRGAIVRYDLNVTRDFHLKGIHFTSVIKGWDNDAAYDFALPVDCDEFLAVFDEHGLTRDREAIHRHFDALKGQQASLRIDTSLFNVPGRRGWYAPVRHFFKGFVAARTLDFCDNGHHAPLTLNKQVASSSFTYLHEHHHPYEEWRRRLRVKVEGLVDLDDEAAMRHYLTIPGAEGVHAVASLLIGEAAYLSLYEDEIQLRPAGGGSGHVVLEGPGVPMQLWDAAAYLRRHPDVHVYEIGTLQHYLRHGFHEGRALA